MKIEKEVYINKMSTYHKNHNEVITAIDIFFKDSLTESEYQEIKDISSKASVIKLTLEEKEEILDEKEKEYLRGVIKPFRNEVEVIYKTETLFTNEKREFIVIFFKDRDRISFKRFKKGTMYKGMELDKEYTLEELGL